jgi:asparagine synthase (glutamine-hydrolysing)
MQRYVPPEITDGGKQGFSAPDASWFKGESVEYVKREILDRGARLYRYLDQEAVRRLVNEHLEGKQNRRLFIWSLLNLEKWCEVFLD